MEAWWFPPNLALQTSGSPVRTTWVVLPWQPDLHCSLPTERGCTQNIPIYLSLRPACFQLENFMFGKVRRRNIYVHRQAELLYYLSEVCKQFNKRCDMKLSAHKWEENASKIRQINLNTAHTLLFTSKLSISGFSSDPSGGMENQTLEKIAVWKSKSKGSRLNPHLPVAGQTHRWQVTAPCSTAWCGSHPSLQICL